MLYNNEERYIKCDYCGKEVDYDDTIEGVCVDCIHDLYNYVDYLEYAESDDNIMDEFLDTIFSPKEVREILIKNLPDELDSNSKAKLRDLVDYNDHWIARWLKNGKNRTRK